MSTSRIPCRRPSAACGVPTRPKTAPSSSHHAPHHAPHHALHHASSSAHHAIKGHLRCIFSRSAVSSRPTTPLVVASGSNRSSGVAQSQSHHAEYSKARRVKRKKNTHLGINEEQRVMKILHNLQTVERTKTPQVIREELTQLYIKPLPEYIQDKLKQHEERQMSRSAILFEEIFQNQTLDNSENNTCADKIKLPDQKPLLPSRWQQKMLTKLEKMDKDSSHSSSNSSTPRPPMIPTLNRHLQVNGQSSSCTKTSIVRTKPPQPSSHHSNHHSPSSHHNPPPPPPYRTKQPAFPYSDPLPYPTSYLASKDNTTPFEERILELEKMERDSIIIERAKGKGSPSKDTSSRVPANMAQPPKYLDSTLAFQSRVAQRKPALPNSVTRGGNGGARSLTPTAARATDALSKRRNLNMREKDTILQQKRKNSSNNKLSISAK